MKWGMDASLEKIWDLHDKISDAIHGISSTHFFKSTLGNPKNSSFGKNHNQHKTDDEFGAKPGFVFVKELGVYVDDQAIADARSLNGIRTALENLEDQLEFFNTVQLHQRVERDAAIARLEQSRVILAMKLADHRGQKYKVIEEALSFVGDVHEAGLFGVSENASDQSRSHSSDNNLEAVNENNKTTNNLVQFLMSGVSLAKKSLRFDGIGSILGNCTLFAVSMLAIFQLHQRAIKSGFDITIHQQGLAFMTNNVPKSSISSTRIDSFSQDTETNCDLEVLMARG